MSNATYAAYNHSQKLLKLEDPITLDSEYPSALLQARSADYVPSTMRAYAVKTYTKSAISPLKRLLIGNAPIGSVTDTFAIDYAGTSQFFRDRTLTDRSALHQSIFAPSHSGIRETVFSLFGDTPVTLAACGWASSLQRDKPVIKEATVRRFHALANEWRETRNAIGSTLEICSHRAYQQIIGMGQVVVSLILQDLRDRGVDYWFWALAAITGENPVALEHQGRLDDMAKDWLNWGKKQGFQF